MEESISIREIRLEDTQAIQDIRIAISEEDAQVDFQKLIEQHISEGKGNTSLVAEVNGKVVGFMISTTLYAGFGIGKSAWIMSFGIHPDHMGHGLFVSQNIIINYCAKRSSRLFTLPGSTKACCQPVCLLVQPLNVGSTNLAIRS